jgi:tungstate transport system substrate-binding protein
MCARGRTVRGEVDHTLDIVTVRLWLENAMRRLLPFVLVLASCTGQQPSSGHLVLATTTSVGNSGLLDVLLPAFKQEQQLDVRSHLAGSGLALRMLEKGDADIVISHAPAAEATILRAHPDWRYRKIMFNDFVIVGPPDDPAHVKGANDAGAAMRQIAVSDARFLSRGDQSGTHEREEALWRLAGERPGRERLIVAGAGMGATLRVANETGAYTLTDRATFTQHLGTLSLTVVFEGGPLLLNTYAVVIDPSGPRATGAQRLYVWLSDGVGREVIQGYQLRGVQAFFPWPAGRPREDPDAVPR